ncbi:MAG: ABC transporter ATP-binding protein [Anaerolineae bacterium]|nr:ABC transporter ATP-binding protein [Anaerolineae bacterium]
MKTSLGQYGRLWSTYLTPQRGTVLLLAVLLFGNIGLQLFNPQVMRQFIDLAQAGAAPDVLVRIALLFVGVALLQQVLSVFVTWMSENVGWAATNALRGDLVAHCIGLDMSFHNAHTPGEMIERIDGDVTVLSAFFSQFVIQVLGNGLLLVGVLVLLFREDWRVGLTLTAFTLIALVTLGRLRNIAVPHWAAERQANAEFFGFLEERLAGTEDIRSSAAEPYVLRAFHALMRTQMRTSLKAALMINVLLNTIKVLTAVGTAAALGISGYLFLSGHVTLGTVYLAFHYTTMLERPIDTITRQMQELQKAGAGMLRARELLGTTSRIQEATRPVPPLPDGPLAVTFEDVSFSYADGQSAADGTGQATGKETVLHDLSFSLRPGTVLGLLGRTGSGKTTLTRLLFRLYDPDAGSVRLGAAGDLVDIRQVALDDLRRHVGMVTQNIQLFHATVRDNLTFFDPTVGDARILQALEELGLTEWLDTLPDGLDTVLESGGSGLSAGEAQLLAFTRIFLKDPGLVILDEASSRLDPVTERLIERAVEKLVRNRTAIIIAHRLGTVERADEVMILQDGRVGEHGERAALASDPASHFRRLLQAGLEDVLV